MPNILLILKMKINRWRSLSKGESLLSIYRQETNRVYGVNGGLTITSGRRCQRGDRLEHTGGEKFDGYIEWLDYLVEHFFSPWGIKIIGLVRYEGDMLLDAGTIEIIDNRIEVRPNIYPRICPKGAMYICEGDSELEIEYVIESIPQKGRCANDDPDCQYRVVKYEDGNSREHLYPTNTLWQIDRLRADDLIIALDPSGNPIEIHHSELDCFVSIDIVLQEFSINLTSRSIGDSR
jgi:hypothetical protein